MGWGSGTARAEGTGGGQGSPQAAGVERVAEPGERRLGAGAQTPGSRAACAARGPGAARPGPSSQGAEEPSRRHCPSGTGARACAGSDPTTPAPPAGPGSPSAERGCVSPGTRAAAGRGGEVSTRGSAPALSTPPLTTPQAPNEGKITSKWGPLAPLARPPPPPPSLPHLLLPGSGVRPLSSLTWEPPASSLRRLPNHLCSWPGEPLGCCH